MSSVAVRNTLATFVELICAGDQEGLTQAAHEAIARAEDASELIGQIGLIAMQGDREGHAVLTLGAASMLCRWLIALRHVMGQNIQDQVLGISLIVQALMAVAPAVRAGKDAPQNYPQPLFPGEISTEATAVGTALQKAVFGRDARMLERILFGLFGTGADYRALTVRLYQGIGQTFQEDGHTLLMALRGSQVLDAVEWSEDTPHYLHWLAPHLPLHTEEPSWIEMVRIFLNEPRHSLDSYRVRLAAPRNQNALPLRALLRNAASTQEVCQGVYDALITNGASARAVGSVIALAACDLVQSISDEDRALFVRASHGLLYASATRIVYTKVQEVEALPLLFTAAAYINALTKDLSKATGQRPTTQATRAGGGMIAPSLLENLSAQIAAQDIGGAMATVRRYNQLGHDKQALCAVIGLGAAHADATADQGHTLQIVQAAGDEYLAWPSELASTDIEGFVLVALRAAALATRNL
ncbi:MAG: hypothetical protein ACRDHZ_02945 [Ktedonobacteraceae bacterium]